jgi:hypothetical protein
MLSSLLQKAGFKPGLTLHSSVPKLLMAATVAGGACSLLGAGSAHAGVICGFGGVIIPTACVNGQTYTNGDKILTFITIPTLGSGNIDFSSNLNFPPLGPENDTWDISLNFTPNYGPAIPGAFEYNFKIDQTIEPTAYFKKISLDTTHGGINPTASKIIYDTEARFLANTSPIATLVSLNGIASSVDLPFNTYKELWIRDTYTPGVEGSIKTLDNEYTQGDSSIPTVPGPLPVVGAGMALGFSRKLRSRIKSSAAA